MDEEASSEPIPVEASCTTPQEQLLVSLETKHQEAEQPSIEPGPYRPLSQPDLEEEVGSSVDNPTRELEILVYGCLRIAQLEATLDPELQNQIDVIRKIEAVLETGGQRVQIILSILVGIDMVNPLDNDIRKLLKQYQDVFVWSHHHLLRVNKLLGEHRIDLILGLNLSANP